MKVIEERIIQALLKWAGEDSTLNAIVTRLPIHILSSLQIDRYVEPLLKWSSVFLSQKLSCQRVVSNRF